MNTENENAKRKYVPEEDARRFSDGVRLHPLVGYRLNGGWHNFRAANPDCRTTPAEFSRSAIPILQKLGLIELVDPLVDVPKWLDKRDAKLALRGGKRPIWMPTPEYLPEADLWHSLVPRPYGHEIVWPELKLPRKSSRLR